LRAISTDIHSGALSYTGSFVDIDHPSFLVSTVKESDDGRGWLVRGYNLCDEAIEVTIKPWRKFTKAERVNLAEQTIGPLGVGKNGEVIIAVRRHEVATIKFAEL
jgi:alpha-mannosidase